MHSTLSVSERHERTQLLVSVRNASEALAALAGGADVIDVKEPDRGALGAADASTLAAVVGAVDSRAPVTAAVGELAELIQSDRGQLLGMIPEGISLFKIGLAGCRSIADWPTLWRETVAALANVRLRSPPRPVAVVYADWRTANAPEPNEVLKVAIQAGCPALLVDTWNKSAGSLFDHWPIRQTGHFVRAARSQRLIVVLAGSLVGDSLVQAARLDPDLVGVRTAACDAGRRGTISSQRVLGLRHLVDATWQASRPPVTST